MIRILGAIVAFVAALVLAGVGGCNLHELGHLITGWFAGVPVNDILWCAPANGRIVFAYQEPALVGYSGGLLAAVALIGVYFAFIRPRLDSLPWWTAGVAVLGTAGSQVVVGLFEGTDPQLYGRLQDNTAGLVAVVIVPLAIAGLAQALVHPLRPADPDSHRSAR
ncbi:MAG TPA: hypothetical protein VK969_10215 [Acidimicrobiia bacterium]|nr:hypothetical protein [Acidimicrobiia bacterium]